MKGFLLVIVSSLALVSCFKSDNRDLGVYNISNGYIRYQVNNFPYEINGGYNSFSNTGVGVYCKKQLKSASVPSTRYTILGQLSPKRSINLIIITDSLKSSSYVITATANADTIQYSGNRTEDILNLNITRNANGTIEGTFSGKLSNSRIINGSATYIEGIISNGFFQNVGINY